MRSWLLIISLFFLAGCAPKKEDAPPPAPTCSDTQHLENGGCVSNERTCIVPDNISTGVDGTGFQSWNPSINSWKTCQIVNCLAGFDLVGNACLPNCPVNQHHHPTSGVCENNTLSCSIANGTGSQTWIPISKSYSSCVVNTCNSGFEVSGNTCIPVCNEFQHRNFATMLCDPNTISCPIANGVGHRTWNPLQERYTDCAAVSCANDYHIESNLCLPNSKPCSPLPVGAVSGNQLWEGSGYGVCQITACTWNSHLDNNVCVPNVQYCVVPNGTGVRLWTGTEFGECVAETCSENYHVENGLCLPNVNNCNPMPPNAATALQTWDPLTQSYGVCNISACTTNYHIENNACVTDFQDCTAEMPHALAAQKTWGGLSYGACVATSCEANWHLYNGSCQGEVVDCVLKPTVANKITNGNFNTNLTGWVEGLATWFNGTATINQGVNSNFYFRQTINSMVGQDYRLKYDFTSVGVGGTQQFGYALNTGLDPLTGWRLRTAPPYTTPTVGITYNFTALSPSTDIVFATEASASFTRIDNVEVREYSVGPALVATQTWNEDNQSYDACLASACQSNYALIDGKCIYNYVVASGGTIKDAGGYRIHTFTTNDTFRVISMPTGAQIEILMVGGGGGGGGSAGGGGGGGGGVLFGSQSLQLKNYSITIGQGGAGGTYLGPIQIGTDGGGSPIMSSAAGTSGQNGGSTIFDNNTALGGGGGAGNLLNSNAVAGSGGTGGGGSSTTGLLPGAKANPAASGTQGKAGGNGLAGSSGTGFGGGGGGGGELGSSTVGGEPLDDVHAGDGGLGFFSTISGVGTYYAGGGGGGTDDFLPAGAGGNGGGGHGGSNHPSTQTPTNGVDGLGGGGGGGGGAGGSGIVIIRYPYQ